MSEKPLRRKGQGQKQRPICPQCQDDLYRSYVRIWIDKKQKFTPTGWECEKCKFKIWDEKIYSSKGSNRIP